MNCATDFTPCNKQLKLQKRETKNNKSKSPKTRDYKKNDMLYINNMYRHTCIHVYICMCNINDSFFK